MKQLILTPEFEDHLAEFLNDQAGRRVFNANQLHQFFINHAKTVDVKKEQPEHNPDVWYSSRDVFHWLINDGWATSAANSIASAYAENLQSAYAKGWERAYNQKAVKEFSDNDYVYYPKELAMQNNTELIELDVLRPFIMGYFFENPLTAKQLIKSIENLPELIK